MIYMKMVDDPDFPEYFFKELVQFPDNSDKLIHTFGCIGKQHHKTKAINATIVPMRSIKSSIVCRRKQKKKKMKNGIFVLHK